MIKFIACCVILIFILCSPSVKSGQLAGWPDTLNSKSPFELKLDSINMKLEKLEKKIKLLNSKTDQILENTTKPKRAGFKYAQVVTDSVYYNYSHDSSIYRKDTTSYNKQLDYWIDREKKLQDFYLDLQKQDKRRYYSIQEYVQKLAEEAFKKEE